MSAIQFTDADRDERGFVKAHQEPRSLADLLPQVAPVAAPASRKPTNIEQALIGVALLIVFALAVWRVSFSEDAAPASLPRIPTAVPVATQTRGDAVLPPSPIPARMLPAYSAPGVPLGQIEATRAITPVAHFGADWIAYRDGSGLVWLRASDWPRLAITGPDLAPQPTPEVAVVVPEAAAALPEPTQCAEVAVAGKESRSCGTEDLSMLQERARQLWVAAYGGNTGIVATPSPQPWQRTQAIQDHLANEHMPTPEATP